MGLISRVSSRTYRKNEDIMTNAFTDSVIKNRLLVDGEGTFEDKKITDLTKVINAFCDNPESEDLELDLDRTLAQIETNGIRNVVQMRMIKNEQERLKAWNIQEQIRENQDKVNENTEKLKHSRNVRRCEEEADALAAIVEKIPSVPETKRKVNDKFDQRKTEFFSLVASAHQLNTMVNSSS